MTYKTILNLYNILDKYKNIKMDNVGVKFKIELAMILKIIIQTIEDYQQKLKQIMIHDGVILSTNNNYVPSKFSTITDLSTLNDIDKQEYIKILAQFNKDLQDLQNCDSNITINKIQYDNNFKDFTIEEFLYLDNILDLTKYKTNQL